MSFSRSPGPSRLKWAAGATLVLAAFASLGYVFWASSREQGLETIRRAVACATLGGCGSRPAALVARASPGRRRLGDARRCALRSGSHGGRPHGFAAGARSQSRIGERPDCHRGDRDPATPARARRNKVFGVRPGATAAPSSPSSGLSPCSASSGGPPRPARCSGVCSRSRAIPATSPTAS